MALKPTIYKVDLNLVDTDHHRYENRKLTLALHPSETVERMMVRLLVYGLNYHPDLAFTRGLSATEEADLWQIRPDGGVEHWIEVGQATPERVRKAVSRAPRVSLYAYGSEADIWWQKQRQALQALPKLEVWQFDWQQIRQLPDFACRNMALTLSISDGDLYLSDAQRALSLAPRRLI